jgi:HAD superfamily hydrolase (TIGR01509 family)
MDLNKLAELELVIFDLDGTLIDSNGSSNDLDVKLCKWLGETKDSSEVLLEREEVIAKNANGDIYLNYCEYLKNKYNSNLTKEELLQYRRELSKKVSMDIKYKPYAELLLKYLKNKNIKMALATVSRRETVAIYFEKNEHLNKKIKLNNFFDFIITKDDVELKKPNPEVYKKVLQKFNIKDLSKCLVVEDSLTGILAAKAADLNVIATYDKYSDKDREEINKKADYNVKDLKELYKLFKKSYNTIKKIK